MGVDLVAVADLSASETKKLTSKELLQNGVKLIDDGVIPGAKLAPDSVTAKEVAPNAIGASELADGAVDTAAVADLAITNSKIAPGVDGAKLTDDTVTAAKIPAGSLNRGIDKAGGAIGHTNAVTAGSRNGITYDAQGHITGAAPLLPADLPLATATDVGGVSVPATGGLTVSGIGALGHTNTIAGGSRSGITYDAHGHIVTAVALVSSDLPTATSTAPGAASFPGPEVTVDGTGAVHHISSGVAAGTYSKVTVNSTGHITVGAPLTAADVPDLDAAKITGGVLNAARIGDGTISAAKLADYALAYIQESVPPAGVGTHPIGMTWLQESTGQVSVWNGNSWMKTGASTLFNKNLRYCGTYNAATGLVTGVTQFGTADGFKVGDAIPAADDKHAGCYFVASSAGATPSIAAGVAFDAGDWLLCQGATSGWVRIDTLNGGGGGAGGAGGASNLDDLLDVTLTAPKPGDVLHYTAAGQWVNVAFTDAGTYA